MLVQLRLVGELGAASWTKVELPVFVEERDVVLQGQLGVERPEALLALEVVVVFRLQL